MYNSNDFSIFNVITKSQELKNRTIYNFLKLNHNNEPRLQCVGSLYFEFEFLLLLTYKLTHTT